MWGLGPNGSISGYLSRRRERSVLVMGGGRGGEGPLDHE